MSTGTATTNGDLTKILSEEELMKFLQCRVCSKVPSPPIFQCRRGHIICNRCRGKVGDCYRLAKIANCELCQAPPAAARNYLMEGIVEKSTFKCEFLEQGCKVNVTGGELKKHLVTCPFRPIRCHVGRKDGCNHAMIDYNKYSIHLKEIHGFTATNADKDGKFVCTHSFSLPYKTANTRSWKSYYVSFDGKTFIPRICTVGTIDMLKFHVAILGTTAEASKYCVQINFENKSKAQVPSYQFKIPVYSIRKSDKEAADVHQGILNYGALKEIGKVTGEQFEWSVAYKISKIP